MFETTFQQLANAPLMRSGGYQILDKLATPEVAEALRLEARSQFADAQRSEAPTAFPLAERGGQPARRFFSSAGTTALESFYQDPRVLLQLEQSTGLDLTRTGDQGTYSYYARPGDYLSLHRDIDACDVTLITTVEDMTFPNSKGGMLCIYPGRIFEPIANILKTPLQGAKLLRLKQGESLVLLGGIVPHWVLPVKENENRISALLCFKTNLYL